MGEHSQSKSKVWIAGFCTVVICAGALLFFSSSSGKGQANPLTDSIKSNEVGSDAKMGANTAYDDLLLFLQQDLKALRSESKLHTENLQKLRTDLQKDKATNSANLEKVMSRVESLNHRVEELDDINKRSR